jgi:hypothetical protein
MRDIPPHAPTILLDGLAYVESPRWHDGRLWFAHRGTGDIVEVDLNGRQSRTWWCCRQAARRAPASEASY